MKSFFLLLIIFICTALSLVNPPIVDPNNIGTPGCNPFSFKEDVKQKKSLKEFKKLRNFKSEMGR